MKLLNFAAILGDVPLAVVEIHPRILGRINTLVGEPERCVSSKNGHELETWFLNLSTSCSIAVDAIEVITAEELESVIHDITVYRRNISFHNKTLDGEHNSSALTMALLGLTGAVSFVMYYVFTIASTGEDVDGIMFKFLVWAAKAVGWIK